MTTGEEIVDEFHQQTFFYQSIADEWLAKRIDEAIRVAIEAESDKRGFGREAAPVKMEFTAQEIPITPVMLIKAKAPEPPKKARGRK